MPQVISATNARNNFSEILSQVFYNQKEYIVEKQGEKVAMLIPMSRKNNPEIDRSGKQVLRNLLKLNLTGGPKDLSTNIDHYLYGAPKKLLRKSKKR